MTAEARVVVHLIDEEHGQHLVIPAGTVPIPADSPPTAVTVINALRSTADRIEVRREFAHMTAELDIDPPAGGE